MLAIFIATNPYELLMTQEWQNSEIDSTLGLSSWLSKQRQIWKIISLLLLASSCGQMNLFTLPVGARVVCSQCYIGREHWRQMLSLIAVNFPGNTSSPLRSFTLGRSREYTGEWKFAPATTTCLELFSWSPFQEKWRVSRKQLDEKRCQQDYVSL